MTHPVDPNRLLFSAHAQKRMLELGIPQNYVILTLEQGEVIEDYPEAKRGACGLILAFPGGHPLHVVSAYDNESGYTQVITTYYPNPARWNADFRTRCAHASKKGA